jgi:hypothetical protein
MFIKGYTIKTIMKKVVYEGREEGLYVFGTFNHYMNGLVETEKVNESAVQDRGDFPRLIGVWHYKSGITIKSTHIAGSVKNPVKILAFGEEDKINAFEKILNAENEKLKSRVTV